jgi:hypothetical protein
MFYLLSGTVADIVATSVSISLPTSISGANLVTIFQKGKLPEKKWLMHLSTFYTEIPVETIKAFIEENHISQSSFSHLHSKLPSYLQKTDFIVLMNKVYP